MNLAPVLRLGMLKNGVYAGSLVFENVYQQQMAAPVDAWTTLTANLNSGIFWATNASLGPTFANANGGQKTLAQWIAGNDGSTLSVYGAEIGFRIGLDWHLQWRNRQRVGSVRPGLRSVFEFRSPARNGRGAGTGNLGDDACRIWRDWRHAPSASEGRDANPVRLILKG